LFTPLLLLVSFVSRILLLQVSLLLLLMWLWSECCNVQILGCRLFLLVDGIDHGPLLPVSFDPVVNEERLIRVVDCKMHLVLVRKEFADAFRSGSPENLCEQEFVASLDAVICEGSEVVLCIGALWLDCCRMVQLDTIQSVVFMECVKKFLQSGHEFARIFSWMVSEVGESINDKFVIGDGGEFFNSGRMRVQVL
jgi:hypothetical protein